MSGLLLLRTLLFAGECLLASALLPVFVFAVAALLRRRAALRHLAWTTLFGVLAALPLAALLLPPRRIVEHVAAPVAAGLPQAGPVMSAPVMVAPALAASPPSVFTLENLVLLLVALWLVGLAWQLLRLCVGGLGLMRLRRKSAPFALRTGCDVRLDLRMAPGAEGPSTFGIFRPIVLLPRAALGWPSARLEAVLRHEAAHVVRRDTASQLLARLVCALYWPNPLLWLAARAARRDAEIAADDAVLASGMTPSLYAAELLGLAAESRGLAPGIAMAGSPLTERVQSVLATTATRTGVTKMDIAKTACLGLTAALLLGAARFDIAVAQDAPATPATPPAAVRMEQHVAETDARTAAVKARADAVAARAKAKAEAETDPAKKAQYEREAAQVAAQSAQVRMQADQMAAEARRMADEARQKAMQLAQTMPGPQSGASASADAESQNTINGVTTTIRSRNGAPQNEDARRESRQALASIGPQVEKAIADAHIAEAVAKALADAHIDEKMAKALAEAHLDEQTTRAIASVHLEETINKAMAEAQPRIRAAVEQAQRGQRAAPPIEPVAPPAPAAPRALTIPNAPSQN
jgi:beta-lactamase regulating signal transducer with metallopeptidase domain